MKAYESGQEVRILCQDCNKEYSYIVAHKTTNNKIFCEECAGRRKYERIKESNNMKKKSGRPRVDTTIILPDSNMTWEDSDSLFCDANY